MNITSCKLLFDVGTLDSRIHHLVISPGGKHMVGLMDSGDMNLYNLATLTSEVNKVISVNLFSLLIHMDIKYEISSPYTYLLN